MLYQILVPLIVYAINLAIGGCPSGWHNLTGLCYLLQQDFSTYYHWGPANAWCKKQDMRGSLPILKDSMSWKVFHMLFKELLKHRLPNDELLTLLYVTRYVPIGLYLENDEWYWLDGTKASDGVDNWQSGQPNGTKNGFETCAGYNPFDGDTGYRDIPCNLTFPYMCQLDPGLDSDISTNQNNAELQLSKSTEACPIGWDTVEEGVCYKTPDVGVTIASADNGLETCTKLHPKAKLPELYNQYDLDNFIRYIGNNPLADHKDIALGVRYKNGSYVNTDGTTSFTDWNSDEPENYKTCVFINDLKGYKWEAKDCSTSAYIICQLDTRKIIQSNCKKSWTQGVSSDSHHCYKLLSNDEMTFDEAVDGCSGIGARLPVFQNTKEFSLFRENILPKVFKDLWQFSVFLGYRKYRYDIQHVTINTFVEVNGQEPQFALPFQRGEPNGVGTNGQPGNCLATGGGANRLLMDDESCSNPGHYVVCQYENTEEYNCNVAITKEYDILCSENSGYFYNGICYMVSEPGFGCTSIADATPAIIRSSNALNNIFNNFVNQLAKFTYIGIPDDGIAEYKTIDGTESDGKRLSVNVGNGSCVVLKIGTDTTEPNSFYTIYNTNIECNNTELSWLCETGSNFKQKGCNQSMTASFCSVLKTVYNKTVDSCAGECAMTAWCSGFNLNTKTCVCQLLVQTDENQSIVTNSHWLYYERL